MAKKATKATRAKKLDFDFTAGYLIQTEFEASGGVHYDRRQISEKEIGRGLASEFQTRKKVDDVELHKDSRSVISRAYYLMKTLCAHTPVGYFADADMLEKLETAFDEVREMAAEFNRTAYQLGSARRVKAEIYPLDVSVDNAQVARRLAALVRERLAGLRDSLRAGDLKEFKEAAERAKNLEKLATGIQRDSIRYALDAAAEGRKELAGALRADPKVDLKKRAALLDIEAIEAAIDMFTTDDSQREGVESEISAA